VSPRYWGTEFPVPTAPTNLLATYDTDTSWVTLNWDAWPNDPDTFDHWVVTRQDGGGDVQRVDTGTLTDPDAPTFTDYEAPLNLTCTYTVYAHNGAMASLATTYGLLVALPGWWVVTPGDEQHSFRIRYEQEGQTRNPKIPYVAHNAWGRADPVVTSGTPRLQSGHLPVEIVPDYYWQVQALREASEYSARNGWVILKTGLRESFRVFLSGWSETANRTAKTQMGADWMQVLG
jgi:hypothetical protein